MHRPLPVLIVAIPLSNKIRSIFFNKFSFSMKKIFFKLALVVFTFFKLIFSNSMPSIILKLPGITISIDEKLLPISTSIILKKITFIPASIFIRPNTISVFLAIFEISLIDAFTIIKVKSFSIIQIMTINFSKIVISIKKLNSKFVSNREFFTSVLFSVFLLLFSDFLLVLLYNIF